MKNKMTPEDFKNIVSHLELLDIAMIECNAKHNAEYSQGNLVINIKDKLSFEQVDNHLVINFKYAFTANISEQENPGLEIKSTYQIKYEVKNGVVISKEFMDIFHQYTIGMLLWPFFREFLNNMVFRMGLPQLILPLKKRP
jgi:preprotein translocase subunit SecB